MSGCVESNPGPLTDSQHIASILAVVQRIEASQSSMMAKITTLESEQKITNVSVGQLSARLSAVEEELTAAFPNSMSIQLDLLGSH